MTIWPSNPNPEHTSGEKHGSKGHVHPNIHGSAVYDNQDMQAT